MRTHPADCKLEIATALVPDLVAQFSPKWILLVGSVARGYADLGSDIDVLLVDAASTALAHVPGAVEERRSSGEKIKLEFHTSRTLDTLRNVAGANTVRELNRLRDAHALYDPAGSWPAIRPDITDIRRAFGPTDGAIRGVERLLDASEKRFLANDFSRTTVYSCMAAEALAILFLSIGNVPIAYTKPKWTWLGLGSADPAGKLQSLFARATQADILSGTSNVAAKVRAWADFADANISSAQRAQDRPLRRSVWLMMKQCADVQSLASGGGRESLRSPSLMCVSFGLSGLARVNDHPYQSLIDVLEFAPRLGPAGSGMLEDLLFPNGVPSKEDAAARHNAAVAFYDRLLPSLGQSVD